MGEQKTFFALPECVTGLLIFTTFLTPEDVASLDSAICSRNHRYSFLNNLKTHYNPHCGYGLTVGGLAWLRQRFISPRALCTLVRPDHDSNLGIQIIFPDDVETQPEGSILDMSPRLNLKNVRDLIIGRCSNKTKFMLLVRSCPQLVSLSLCNIDGLSEMESFSLEDKQLDQLETLSLSSAKLPTTLWMKVVDRCRKLKRVEYWDLSTANSDKAFITDGVLSSIIINNAGLTDFCLLAADYSLNADICSALLTRALHSLEIMVNDIPVSFVVDWFCGYSAKCPAGTVMKQIVTFTSQGLSAVNNYRVEYDSTDGKGHSKLSIKSQSAIISQSALAIVSNLPKLARLDIDMSNMTPTLLQAIVKLCPVLKCFSLKSFPELGTEQIIHLIDSLPQLCLLEVEESDLISEDELGQHLTAIDREHTVTVNYARAWY